MLGEVDRRTIEAYDREPGRYAEDWHRQPAPGDLHELVKLYFRPGRTADVGCGSGRDTAWLSSEGFDVIGYDASPGLLAEARRRYPYLTFLKAELPELNEIDDKSFENALCETVIMHLRTANVALSVRRLLAILRPGGTLYLSWRVTQEAESRSDDDRLYSGFPASLVLDALGGATVLHESEETSASSGKRVHRLVARRSRITAST
jgi:SAM-dependent methyltransferase